MLDAQVPFRGGSLIHANFINVTGARRQSNVIESSHDRGGGSATQVGPENHSRSVRLAHYHGHSGLPPVAHTVRRTRTVQAGAFESGCLILLMLSAHVPRIGPHLASEALLFMPGVFHGAGTLLLLSGNSQRGPEPVAGHHIEKGQCGCLIHCPAVVPEYDIR